jgi:charged multivesicular body protein 4
MNLFGRSKPSAAAPTPSGNSGGGNDTTVAISKIRDQIEMLTKREEHLYRKMDNEVKQAKEFSAKGKKREALTCIKRKKMFEKQVDQIANSKFTLETQQSQLEMININKETLRAHQAGANTMHRVTREMGGVEAVEELMDNIEEGMQDANEMGEAMGRPINSGLDADDDELAAELEALEQEGLTDQLTSTNVASAPAANRMSDEEAELQKLNASMNFPSAPTSRPAAGKQMTEEERELAELEASMGMAAM